MAEQDDYLKEIRSPSTLKRVLDFEVPRERVEQEITRIIALVRQDVNIPGFRKGKAPEDVVRARFAGTAQKEAIEKIIPRLLGEVLERE